MRNPLSIEAFADWCEKQPADAEFDYGDTDNCALGQYAAFLGLSAEYKQSDASGSGWWFEIAYGVVVGVTPYFTFGALASRLRASLKEQG